MARVFYSNDVLTTSGTGASARLIPLVNAAFTVSTLTGNPVPLYNSYTATSTLGSTVYSDSNGIVRFYVDPGHYVALITSGTSVNRTEEFIAADIGTSGGGLPSDVPMIFPESSKYKITPLMPDATAAFQAMIDDIYTTYGRGEIILGGIYNISTLNFPDTIDVRGLSRSETGFNRINNTTHGPMMVLNAIRGRDPRRLRQNLSKFSLYGNNVGTIRGTGIVTIGSDIVTNVSPAVLAQLLVGYRIEGIGIPKDTWVTSIGSTSVTMSVPADRSNSPKTNITFRRGVSVLANASVIGRSVTVPHTNNIDVGMRVSGFIVDDDDSPGGGQETLNAWTRVVSVDRVNNLVFFDRDVVAVGSYTTNFFVANDGLLVNDGKLAPDYDPNLNYCSVGCSDIDIINAGYHGLIVRGRRNQFQGRFMKVSNCQGAGVVMTAASDSFLEHVGTGTNWMWALSITAQATPRWSGEAWQTYVNDKYPDVFIRGSREFTAINCDVNGRMLLMGNNSQALTQQVYTLSNINFKWTDANNIPGSTDTAYIEARNCVVDVIGGGLVPDADSLDRPHHGAKVTTGGIGAVVFHDQHWNDDPADPWCPWSVSMGRGTDNVLISGVTSTKSKSLLSLPNRELTVGASGSVTLTDFQSSICINSTVSVSSLTVLLPASPGHGQTVSISFAVNVTTFTLGSSGTATVLGAPTTGIRGTSFKVSYDRPTTRWILSF